MMVKKDNRIELYRFIAAVIIMIFHAHNINNGQGHPIPLGHVFVEFFFFLTGYFTYANLVKNLSDADSSTYPFRYTWKKFGRFVPYVLMTAIFYVGISVLCNCLIEHLLIRDTLLEFSGFPFDILLLQVTGICRNPNFNAWWYLSALLFTMPLAIILFYKKIREGGVYTYIVYFVPLLIYGTFSVEINALDWDREIFWGIKTGIFRGYAGLCVGCTIYDIKNRLSAINVNKVKRLLLTVVELGSFVLAVLVAWKWSEVKNSTFLIVFLLIIGLIISLSDKSYTVCLNKAIFSWLGMLSLPLYICHYSIGRLIGRYFVCQNIHVRYLLYFISSFVFAICMLVVNRKVSKRVEK